MSATQFSQSAVEALEAYVYCLVDPRDNKVFYVGKGRGNRVFDHARGAMETNYESEKISHIKDIISEGKAVKHYILRHGLKDEVAFEVEAAMIDFLSYPEFNLEKVLTNLQSGHDQWDRGIKNVDEIEQTYTVSPIEINPNEKILCFNLNRSYRKGCDIYEITRGWWKLSKTRIKHVNIVLGIYNGIVRGVYRPETWMQAHDNKDEGRWGFEGTEIKDSPYMNKNTRGIIEFGSGNPVKYVNC